MSDFATAAGLLRIQLETFAGLPVRWPNDSRPADLTACPNGFVLGEVRLTDEGPACLGVNGDRRHRDFGELSVYVYVPRGTLPGGAETHATAVRALFPMTGVGDVVITRKTIGAGAVVEDGRLYAIPVTIEWFSDRTE